MHLTYICDFLSRWSEAGALESFLRSSDDAESPHLAVWPQDVTFLGEEQFSQARPVISYGPVPAGLNVSYIAYSTRNGRCPPLQVMPAGASNGIRVR